MSSSTLEPMHPLFDFTEDDVLDNLTTGMNPAQAQAVAATEGPLLILAGAGSGKTRVLTHRIAHILAARKARRNQIMAVTFTNKAAKEMAERIEHLCGSGRFPDLGTFHSVCARWLRREAEILGMSPSFAIFATAEQLVVMKESIRELGLDDKKFTPRGILSQVSGYKNQMVTAEELKTRAHHSRNPFDVHVADIYSLYQRKLKQNQALDFDDILWMTVEMLQRFPEVRQRYQERLRYILIDEYQDVNAVQYELVKLLSQRHRNICAVGDDDQSIYAFRGADVSILLRFEKDFRDARVIKLEQNYRSTQKILDAANAVVAHNKSRKAKKLWTDKNGGESLRFYLAGDGRDEGRFIAREIRNLYPQRAGYADFVLLYRTNSQSRLLEEAMIQAAIPYKIVGGLRFFERKEIKDVLSYLCVLVNPADSINLRRMINTPTRGVGATSMERLLQAASEADLPLWEVLQGDLGALPGKAREALKELVAWMKELAARKGDMKVTDILEEVLQKSRYRDWLLQEDKVEAQVRLENLDELVNVTSEYDRNAEEGSLEGFLSEVSLLSDQDTYAEGAQSVTLMTLHAAKGLEFPVVFLAGLEEETFPHIRSLEDDDQLEEERRLCYVGITRAKEILYLTSAQSREFQGARMLRKPSRFLREIPKALLTHQGLPPAAAQRSSPAQRAASSPAIGSGQARWAGWGAQASKGPAAIFAVGDEVTHNSFGNGRVVAVDRDILTVEFETKGTKQVKQDFLKRAGAPVRNVKVGDRVQHPRFGNGLIKSIAQGQATLVFGQITAMLSLEEVGRLPAP